MALYIKICCIASGDEARRAIEAGADGIGLVSWMPSGPGVIEDEIIRAVAAEVAGQADTFLLTSRTAADAILEQLEFCRSSAVQLVDRVAPGTHATIRAWMPAVRIVQVLHVNGPDTVDEARDLAGRVDMILLDSGKPELATKQFGGTGRTHNWEISRRIVAAADCPVLLAGGLNAENVASGLATVRSHGVDVCSGVRRAGALDPARLDAFVAAARGPATSS